MESLLTRSVFVGSRLRRSVRIGRQSRAAAVFAVRSGRQRQLRRLAPACGGP